MNKYFTLVDRSTGDPIVDRYLRTMALNEDQLRLAANNGHDMEEGLKNVYWVEIKRPGRHYIRFAEFTPDVYGNEPFQWPSQAVVSSSNRGVLEAWVLND